MNWAKNLNFGDRSDISSRRPVKNMIVMEAKSVKDT
jgi:hypothetical protein